MTNKRVWLPSEQREGALTQRCDELAEALQAMLDAFSLEPPTGSITRAAAKKQALDLLVKVRSELAEERNEQVAQRRHERLLAMGIKPRPMLNQLREESEDEQRGRKK